MKIKDIIYLTATMLRMDPLANYLNTQGATTTDDVTAELNSLVTLTNLVIDELSGSFIPLIKEESVTDVNGEILYEDLSKNVTKIISVLSSDGKELSFTVLPQSVKVKGSAGKIIYQYFPSLMSANDECGYTEKDISARALAYGVAAEYCITLERFSEAVMWRNRFEAAVNEKCFNKSVVRSKARRWN